MWIPQPQSGKAKVKGQKPEVRKGGPAVGAAAGAASRAEHATQKTREDEKVSIETAATQKETVRRPMLANAGAMSTFVGVFDVTSRLTGKRYNCRFSHMWNGIATRHADTIDTKFFVDGAAIVVGLAHTAFVKFRERSERDLTDREASFVAAEYLSERLEEEDERPLYDVAEADVLRLIDAIGIR